MKTLEEQLAEVLGVDSVYINENKPIRCKTPSGEEGNYDPEHPVVKACLKTGALVRCDH